MFKIKHLMDAFETDDGHRLWVEPIGLTKDLVEWCAVDHLLPQFAPPKKLWEWFDEHPEGYEFFRGQYHEHLGQDNYRKALLELAKVARDQNFTLLHSGGDEQHNSATALYEFLSELSAYLAPE